MAAGTAVASLTCPKHGTSITSESPICPECHYPLKCPEHDLSMNMPCRRCGRDWDLPVPPGPRRFGASCYAHMLESDRNGKCGYCGRGTGDAVGPPRRDYEAMRENWERAVAAAEAYCRTAV